MTEVDKLAQKAEDVSLNGDTSSNLKRVPFGKELIRHFSFDPSWKNLNHGSFGTFPSVIKTKQREYQDLCESAPDPFIRYTHLDLLDKSREAIAKVLNAPTSTVVFVPNATTGVNTALRNIVWNTDGKDEIIYFSTIYGACGNTIEYVCETHHYKVNPRKIPLTYPLLDSEIVALFKDAISASRAAGKRPRLAVYDTISSLPGLRFPFEALTAICKEEGITSVIDGAHGVGHIHIDLTALDPDYFVSNVHKWLHVPRGCAVFYSPERNHHLIRSTLPTSHGFVPLNVLAKRTTPLPANNKSEYVHNFEFVGTIDNTNYIVVPDAIKWREEVLGGEAAIINHLINLSKTGGSKVAEILGTKILDNAEGTMTNCALVNVLLPLNFGDGDGEVKLKHVKSIWKWIDRVLIDDYKTYILVYWFQDQLWARFSAQVYVELEDYVWGAKVLLEIVERVKAADESQWA